jgi:hypothetical protein
MESSGPPKQSTEPSRQLIVQVRWGKMACHKAIIAPGQVLQVGRSEQAGLAVPHDQLMAPLHFELAWNGKNCQFRNLAGINKTLLDGLAVVTGEVFNGSWVRAGMTDFSVYVEGATPPKVFAEPDTAELMAHKTQTLELLRSLKAPLFAVVDAARDPRILVLLRESVEEHRSLYEGPQGDSLEEVAPYLVTLPKGSRLLESLVWEGWGKSWGIYLACSHPFVDVRRHLRKFLMVEAENVESRLYFRFYDPRVLQVFLSSCSREQEQLLFKDIDYFLLEASNNNALMKHRPKQ